MSYARLIRFWPKGSIRASPLIGEPVDPNIDVGLASFQGRTIEVDVFSGNSILDPGERTGQRTALETLLSPLHPSEVGTIRCIGLNVSMIGTEHTLNRQYISHAKEMNLPLPEMPTVFHKPASALSGPFPSVSTVPRHVLKDDCADYEAELAVIIGKTAKNVPPSRAMDYVLGYTASNDLSSRVAQTSQSQWCYSKSFDGSCPIGPVLLRRDQVNDLGDLTIRGSLNGETRQDCSIGDLIFPIQELVSFLSQGTTLSPGTVILTGTPAGVGWSSNPRVTLQHGDQFRVHISHGVGTLINNIEHE